MICGINGNTMGDVLRYNGEHGQQMKYLENIGMIAKNNSGFRFSQHNIPAVCLWVFPLGICSDFRAVNIHGLTHWIKSFSAWVGRVRRLAASCSVSSNNTTGQKQIYKSTMRGTWCKSSCRAYNCHIWSPFFFTGPAVDHLGALSENGVPQKIPMAWCS